jgi:hypothetical protein
VPIPSQNFVIPFENRTPGLSFQLTGNNAIPPRVPRMLGRVVVLDQGTPGTLDLLKAGGKNLLVGQGFPVMALSAQAQGDADNLLGFPCGPEMPLELGFTYDANAPLAGYIGTDPIPEPLLDAALDAIQAGAILGSENWGWGLGRLTIAGGTSGQFSTFIPREANLTRFFCYAFDTVAGAFVNNNVVFLEQFDVAGDDQFGRSGGSATLDVNLCTDLNTDEDGMRVNIPLTTRDQVVLSFNNTGANQVVVYAGFLADDYDPMAAQG